MVYVLGKRTKQGEHIELIDINTVVFDNKRNRPVQETDYLVAYDGGNHLYAECTLTSLRSLLALGIRKFWLPVALTKDDQCIIHRGNSLIPATNIGNATSPSNVRDYNLINADYEPIVGGTLTTPLSQTLRRVYHGVGSSAVNYIGKPQPFLTMDEVIQFANTNDVEIYLELQCLPSGIPISEIMYQLLLTYGVMNDRTYVYYGSGSEAATEYVDWRNRWKELGVGIILDSAHSQSIVLALDPTWGKFMTGVVGIASRSFNWDPSFLQTVKAYQFKTVSLYINFQYDQQRLRQQGSDLIVTGDPLYALQSQTRFATFRARQYPIGFLRTPAPFASQEAALDVRGTFLNGAMFPDRTQDRDYMIGSLKLTPEELLQTYDLQLYFRTTTQPVSNLTNFNTYLGIILCANADRFDTSGVQFYLLKITQWVWAPGRVGIIMELYYNVSGTSQTLLQLVSLRDEFGPVNYSLLPNIRIPLNIRITPNSITATLEVLPSDVISLTQSTSAVRGPYTGFREYTRPFSYDVCYETLEVGKNLF